MLVECSKSPILYFSLVFPHTIYSNWALYTVNFDRNS